MSKKYLTVYTQLKKDICSGVYNNGDKLPTEDTLTNQFSVSRQTVRQALDMLLAEGLIRKTRGSGTYVQKNTPQLSTKRIAVIAQTFTETDFPLMLSGIESVLSSNGYATMLYATYGNVMRERQILTQLCDEPVDGILLCAAESQLGCANLELIRRLRNMGTKFLFFGIRYPDRELEDIPSVTMDDYEGIYHIVRDLIERGHSSVGGFFSFAGTLAIARSRAVRQAIMDAGLQYSSASFPTIYATSAEELQLQAERLLNQPLPECELFVFLSGMRIQPFIQKMQAQTTQIKTILVFDKTELPPCDGINIIMYKGADATYGEQCAIKLLNLISGQEETSLYYPWEKV